MSYSLVRHPLCPSPGAVEPNADASCYKEIRELDSERQSLVYNHHHELIAASDTIAAVRYTPRCDIPRHLQEYSLR